MLFTNELYIDDNLSVMSKLPTNSIDLIIADPPFNSNRDYGEFDDRFNSTQDYLDFMRPRLKQIHRILKPTGSFYLHCDPSACHYLKVLLDTIFGEKNFRREIIWQMQTPSGFKTTARNFIRQHDNILYYVKCNKYKFNKLYGKGGVNLGDVWYHPNSQVTAIHEEQVYPTQKPIELYDLMVRASSDIDDIVLDPFHGSGTTLIVAKKLGRQYIGIDTNQKAHDITKKRLRHTTYQPDLFELFKHDKHQKSA